MSGYPLKCLAIASVLLLVLQANATAQTATPQLDIKENSSYAYSVFFGTGFYRLDDRKIFVLRMPISYRLREPEEGKMGIKLLLPVAVGVSNFSKLEDIVDFEIDNITTITFAPGVELQFRVKERWDLKPFAQFGVGYKPDENSTDLVWGAGLRTRYTFPGEKNRFIIGGEVLSAGTKPDEGDTNTMNRLGIGVDYSYPIRWSPFNRSTRMHWRLINYNYLGGFEIDSFPDFNNYEIDWEIRLGVALSVDPALKIFGIPASALGIGYRYSEHSEAIVVETTFPF